MSAQLRMPPFAVVAAALRKTTEHLAGEVAQSSASPPEWTEVEWAIAQSAAAMQGISALLANALSWTGPPHWQAFLADQRAQSALRDAHIGALLEQIDGVTRKRGVDCLALKGAALRVLDLYRPGERPMADIDLLVARRDLDAIGGALAEIGYVEAFTVRRHVVYEPRVKTALRGFGEHVDNPLNIEVHTAIGEALPVHSVDITEHLRRARPRPGLNHYPDLISLLLHLLLHAAKNMRAHALRQVQLHDVALVAGLLDDPDWVELLERPQGSDGAWWLFPPLRLTARYYAGRIPEGVLRAARAACPPILRRAAERQSLTDVSWSNLRIHAFPGIAWSRTPLEALRFVRTRLAPSRRALAELAAARRAQPILDHLPWYGASHGSRVLRWLFSRPPRVQTIVSVRAALESVGAVASKAAD